MSDDDQAGHSEPACGDGILSDSGEEEEAGSSGETDRGWQAFADGGDGGGSTLTERADIHARPAAKKSELPVESQIRLPSD